MQIIKHLKKNFGNFQELNNKFVGTPPYPMVTLENFLPQDFALKMSEECQSIPDQHWTEFTRKGSYMKECKKLEHAPVAYHLFYTVHHCSNRTV